MTITVVHFWVGLELQRLYLTVLFSNESTTTNAIGLFKKATVVTTGVVSLRQQPSSQLVDRVTTVETMTVVD